MSNKNSANRNNNFKINPLVPRPWSEKCKRRQTKLLQFNKKQKELRAQRKAKPRFSRRLSGLTCKGSLVQVHSSTPEKTVKPQGLSLKGTKIDQWVKAGTGQEKIRSSKRWSDFSLYTDENSSEVTTISELFGFYEFIFGVIPMLSSSSASSCRLWTFSFLYAFLR